MQGVASLGNSIVAAGVAENSPGGAGLFGLARYRSKGSLDSSFGHGGVVTTNFGLGGDSFASAVAVQHNKRIVAVGYAANTSDNAYYWAIARYKSNGSLDPSFGNHGLVVTTFGLTYDFANAVTIQSDGKIVVAGSAGTDNGTQLMAVARYNSNGSLDYTFGTGGMVTTKIGASTLSIGHAVTLNKNDVVVAGYSGADFSDTEPVLVAYNATNGTLDSGFGTHGVESFSLGAGGNYFSAIIPDNGAIVAAGEDATSNNGDFLVAKVSSNGSPVGTFGTRGIVSVDFAGATNTASAVVIDSAGDIVVVGESFGSTDQVALARLLPGGSLDTRFGTGGKTTTAAGPGGSAAYSATIVARDTGLSSEASL